MPGQPELSQALANIQPAVTKILGLGVGLRRGELGIEALTEASADRDDVLARFDRIRHYAKKAAELEDDVRAKKKLSQLRRRELATETHECRGRIAVEIAGLSLTSTAVGEIVKTLRSAIDDADAAEIRLAERTRELGLSMSDLRNKLKEARRSRPAFLHLAARLNMDAEELEEFESEVRRDSRAIKRAERFFGVPFHVARERVEGLTQIAQGLLAAVGPRVAPTAAGQDSSSDSGATGRSPAPTPLAQEQVAIGRNAGFRGGTNDASRPQPVSRIEFYSRTPDAAQIPYTPKSADNYVVALHGGTQVKERRHESAVGLLAEYLRVRGAVIGTPHPIDLLVREPILVMVEVKKVGDRHPGHAIREAVGQLLEYRYFIGPREAQMCIFIDAPPRDPILIDYVEKELSMLLLWLSEERVFGGARTVAAFRNVGVDVLSHQG